MSSLVAIAPELLNGVYGGTKAYVMAFTRSLNSELSAKGIRVQAVLPGSTASEFWNNAAGSPKHEIPKEMVMSTEELVDAALSGLTQGELFTIPSLPNLDDFKAYEKAREALIPNLSREHAAERYGLSKHPSV
jgi:short-subunit dehydrogenase